ncbi:binding-protein-dependent transport systems inner membrane component [Thermobaculum terrenum ATCC BAA-798]|uniref:Binding-protein-dependent transport systems inner membrane component n=1 Tax=Thermobaculum terrenum (strain ATCC BAA-798 / CCMEE 7001 / YNP1) TaxID=525904 RepID=D1CHJ4_THET1|nr:sugar ABC transporter permease [Thermobaculum terrenum]ACZ43215.1 binding-protein-dependent transport systems inner membrane component [Thermobaculum terrenum ATCC BAA-798]
MQIALGRGLAFRRHNGTMSRSARREELEFYLFISPWLIGFLLFGAGPIVASALISFTDWSLLSSPHWIGIENYRRLVQDPLFYKALVNTIYFGAGSVILGVIVSFLLALLLNQKVWGMPLFRTIFYLPSVVAGIATALLWVNIFHPDFGMINYVLGLFGIQGPGWLQSEEWVIPALIIMSVWGAGNTMVIYLAGLQNIPEHLYEAAAIDGAGAWSKFWHVTVPMISPVIFFNLVTGFIASLQAFVLILVMTNGGPADASLVYGLYIYRQAFEYFDMGYASALAWVLFVLIILITALQFKFAQRWVYYEGDIRG